MLSSCDLYCDHELEEVVISYNFDYFSLWLSFTGGEDLILMRKFYPILHLHSKYYCEVMLSSCEMLNCVSELSEVILINVDKLLFWLF